MPFPQTDAFCALQQTTFENIVTIAGMTHNEQFLYLPQCFPLSSNIILSCLEIFTFLSRCLYDRLLQFCHYWERVRRTCVWIERQWDEVPQSRERIEGKCVLVC